MAFFDRWKEKFSGQSGKFFNGLAKTRENLAGKMNDLVARYRKVDEDFLRNWKKF